MQTDILGMLGRVVGAGLSPAVFLASFARGKRVFHPGGLTYRGRVIPMAGDPRLEAVAERLSGFALLRLSSALFAGPAERQDALGVAVRFRKDPEITAEAADGDQDLLTVSFDSLLGAGRGIVKTEYHDFLANDYWAIAPFEVAGLGKAKLRLVGSRSGPATNEVTREERLLQAARAGKAWLRLDALPEGEDTWLSIAQITLEEPALVDQHALKFYPFRDGKGLTPRGFQHGLRLAAYRASEAARGLRGG